MKIREKTDLPGVSQHKDQYSFEFPGPSFCFLYPGPKERLQRGNAAVFTSCYVLLCLSQIVPFPLLHELKLWRLLAVGSGCQNGVHVLNNLWSMTNRNWSRAETALLLCQPRAAPFFLMQQDRGCQDCGLHAGSPMPHSFIQHILLPHAEPSLLSLKTHSF